LFLFGFVAHACCAFDLKHRLTDASIQRKRIYLLDLR
jgi:hypothetical protein